MIENRREIVLDDLVSAYLELRRTGIAPAVADYASQHAEFERDLLRLLPLACALEPSGRSDQPPARNMYTNVPSRLGHYRIVREIGRGGMGVVFEAEDERLGRRAALKVLPDLDQAAPEVSSRFEREAQLIARLDHPAICALYEVVRDQGTVALAMRFVQGETLGARLGRASQVPTAMPDADKITEICGWLEVVARGLSHAHAAGVVHRDIKPDNIMIDTEGNPVLLDFGLAKTIGLDAESLTRTGKFAGTPAYLAPEVLQGGGSAGGAAADQYALGATLYEALVNRRPFLGHSLDRLYWSILREEPTALRSLNPRISLDLEAVVLTTLEKSPARRYASMEALAEDLRAVRLGQPVLARRPGPIGRARRWVVREPLLASLVIAVALLAPTLAAFAGHFVAKAPELARAEKMMVAERLERTLDAVFREFGEGQPMALGGSHREILERSGTPEAIAALGIALINHNEVDLAISMLSPYWDKLEFRPLVGRVLEMAWNRRRMPERSGALKAELGPPHRAFEHFLVGLNALDAGHRGRSNAFAEAMASFRRAIELSPVARVFYVGAYAHAAGHQGDRDLTLRLAGDLTQLWPESPESWSWRALAESFVDPSLSAASCRESLRLDSERTGARELLGSALLDLGEQLEARAIFERLVSENPGAASYQLNLARTYQKGKNHDRALEIARAGEALAPRSPQILASLAAMEWSAGDLVSATETYRRVVACTAHPAMAWACLGDLYAKQGKTDDARAAFVSALSTDPDHPRAHAGLGLLLFDAGEVESALRHFQAAAELEPGIPSRWSNVVVAAERLGRSDLVVKASETLYELNPGNPTAQGNLLGIYHRQGRFLDAKRVAERVLALGESELPISYAVWLSLLEVGEDTRSLALAERSLERWSTDQVALGMVETSAWRCGRWDRMVALHRHRPATPADVQRRRSADRVSALDSYAIAHERYRAGELPDLNPAHQGDLAWFALHSSPPDEALETARRVGTESDFLSLVAMEVPYPVLLGLAAGRVAIERPEDSPSLVTEVQLGWREALGRSQALDPSVMEHRRAVQRTWCRVLLDPGLEWLRAGATTPAHREAWTRLETDIRALLARL